MKRWMAVALLAVVVLCLGLVVFGQSVINSTNMAFNQTNGDAAVGTRSHKIIINPAPTTMLRFYGHHGKSAVLDFGKESGMEYSGDLPVNESARHLFDFVWRNFHRHEFPKREPVILLLSLKRLPEGDGPVSAVETRSLGYMRFGTATEAVEFLNRATSEAKLSREEVVGLFYLNEVVLKYGEAQKFAVEN